MHVLINGPYHVWLHSIHFHSLHHVITLQVMGETERRDREEMLQRVSLHVKVSSCIKSF